MVKTSALRLLVGVSLLAPLSTIAAQTAKDAPRPDTVVAKALPVDGVAAIVGEKIITISDLRAEAERARAGSRTQLDSAGAAKLLRDVLQGLVDAEVLVQRAIADKIEVKELDIEHDADEQIKEVRGRFPSDAEFQTALKEQGYGTLEGYRRVQIEQLRKTYLQRELFQKQKKDGKLTSVNVTEAEVSEAYLANKAQMPRKLARVGFRQIVIATSPTPAAKLAAKAKADSIQVELVAHPDLFESTAKRESMDLSNKDVGGDLGWHRRGRMVPEYDRIAFALNPNVISPVFETPFGYHIIRVDKIQPAEVKSRHILIRAKVDSNDAARTKILADSVANVWRAGAKYDTLVARFHDSANEEKSLPEYNRDSLPESYIIAVKDKKLNDIAGPFPVMDPSTGQPKFVVLQLTMVDEAGEYTLGELRERIRSQLSEERGTRRYIDQLRKQTYVSVRYSPDGAVKPKM